MCDCKPKSLQVKRDDNHPKFIGNLRTSEEFRWLAAQWLNKKGYSVKVPVLREAPSRDDWEEYTDEGDLEICRRFEVKGISRVFTCAEDWPFGGKFIVCAKHSYDRSAPKPMGFMVVSADRIHAAVANCTDSPTWWVERKLDSRYGEEQDFYISALDRINFITL